MSSASERAARRRDNWTGGVAHSFTEADETRWLFTVGRLQSLFEDAVPAELDGLRIKVISFDHLRLNEQAAGRPKISST